LQAKQEKFAIKFPASLSLTTLAPNLFRKQAYFFEANETFCGCHLF
jgi:hypothetical protein